MMQVPASNMVLHVLAALDFGGVESQMRVIAEHSRLSRYRRAFCAIGPGGAVLGDLRAVGVRADALERQARIPSVSAIMALYRHIRSLRPGIVHLHGAEANFHGAIAARLARVPIVIAEEIGIPRHSLRARSVFRQVYRRCDKVLAISQAVAHSILELGEAEPDRIEVIHNPFTVQRFRSLPSLEGGLRLAFVGRLEAVKNPICAIEALALLRRDGIEASLVMVGEGSQRPLLETQIRKLGLASHVKLSGFHPRPFELLEGCHLYLQPSLTEGFGLAICEAMSAGLPVIASAVGGAPEIIDHGRTGWLLDCPEPETLAEIIRTVASPAEGKGRTDLAQMALAARRHVVERFSPETYMAAADRLYDALRASPRRG